ncbi:MAG: flagellar hook-associated protein FlgK [Bacillota bacterium]
MPSTFSTFNIGWKGLFAARLGMDVTGHNVANANTEGYSRQRVALSASSPENVVGLSRAAGPGQIGRGVDVVAINRVKDQFVLSFLQREKSVLGYWEAKAQTYERIEMLFGEPSDSGIAFALDEFFGSLQSLSRNPEDIAVREVVLQKGAVLADTISQVYSHIREVYYNTTDLVNAKVTQLNSLATEIAELNKQIAAVVRVGKQPNDFLDKRDMLIQQMSTLIDIQVLPVEDQIVNIAINGVNLVHRYDTRPLEAVIEQTTGKVEGLKWKEFDTRITVSSGEFAALLETNNVLIPQYLDSLNELARCLVENINSIHSSGYDLDGKKGGLFFVDSRTPDGGPLIPLDLTDPDFEVARYIAINPLLDAREVAAATAAPDENGLKKGDGSNALAMAQLADAAIMQSGRSTLAGFFNGVIAQLGVDSEQASFMADSQGLIVENLKNWDSSISGVSLDEEVTNLMRYQHSYAAAARVITVVDEMLELITTRLGLVGR